MAELKSARSHTESSRPAASVLERPGAGTGRRRRSWPYSGRRGLTNVALHGFIERGGSPKDPSARWGVGVTAPADGLQIHCGAPTGRSCGARSRPIFATAGYGRPEKKGLLAGMGNFVDGSLRVWLELARSGSVPGARNAVCSLDRCLETPKLRGGAFRPRPLKPSVFTPLRRRRSARRARS